MYEMKRVLEETSNDCLSIAKILFKDPNSANSPSIYNFGSNSTYNGFQIEDIDKELIKWYLNTNESKSIENVKAKALEVAKSKGIQFKPNPLWYSAFITKMKSEKDVFPLEKKFDFDKKLPPNLNSNPPSTSTPNFSLRSIDTAYVIPVRSMLTKFKTLDISELEILLPGISRDKIEEVVNSQLHGRYIKKDPNMENVYHYSTKSEFYYIGDDKREERYKFGQLESSCP